MRVVIAEDSVLRREYAHEVVDTLPDVQHLVESVTRRRSDLAIVDVHMPPTFTDEGPRAAVEMPRVCPATTVLVPSQYVEERYARDLLALGADGVGYLLKERVPVAPSFPLGPGRLANTSSIGNCDPARIGPDTHDQHATVAAHEITDVIRRPVRSVSD